MSQFLDDESQSSGYDRVTAQKREVSGAEKAWVLLDCYSIFTRSKLSSIAGLALA
jgi:hypothetical protein